MAQIVDWRHSTAIPYTFHHSSIQGMTAIHLIDLACGGALDLLGLSHEQIELFTFFSSACSSFSWKLAKLIEIIDITCLFHLSQCSR